MGKITYLTNGTGAVAYRRVESLKQSCHDPNSSLRAHHTAMQPIKTKSEYDAFINYFYSKKQFRNILLFVLGIEFGMLRSCDLLKLRISDVFTGVRCRSVIYGVIEQKTGKRQNIYVTETAQKAIEWYLTEHRQYTSLNEPLFLSRKGNQLSTRQARDILHKAGEAVHSECPVAMHSLRKTWGYHTLKNHKNDNMALIDVMKCYNHSNPEVTLRYIGCSEEHKRDICLNFHITDDVKASVKTQSVADDEATVVAETPKTDNRRSFHQTSTLSNNMIDVLAGSMKQGIPYNVLNLRM